MLGSDWKSIPLREERARHIVGIIFLDEGFRLKNKWNTPKRQHQERLGYLKVIKYSYVRDRWLERNEGKTQQNDQQHNRRMRGRW